MANQWFRLYAEFAHDPKVQMLSEVDQRRYIMLLCMRCNGDVTLHETEIAFQLRITDEQWAETRARLLQRKLITKDNNPAAWEKRQYASDSSAERVRRHREKMRNGDVTLQKRPSNAVDTDTDTDTDTDISTDVDIKDKRASRFDKRAHLSSLGVPSQIAIDWIAHRRTKKATVTQTVIDGIVREAGKAGMTLSEALSMCCERGWVGFKAEWITKDQPTPARPINGRQAAISNYAAQAAEARAKNVPIIIERDITGEAVRVA